MYKRIALLSNTSWSIYNFRKNLIKELKKKYDVYVIAPKDNFTEKLIKELNIKFVDIKINNKGANPFEDIKLIIEYYKILKKYKINYILSFTIKPNIYSTIAKTFLKNEIDIKNIINISGLGTGILNNNIITKIIKNLYKITFKYADYIFFQNKDDLKFFEKEKIINKKIQNKIKILPGSGIDLSHFYLSLENIEKTDYKFIFIGRLIKDKGIYEYIEAIKEIQKLNNKNLKFYIMGDIYKNNPNSIKEKELNEWIKEELITYIPFQEDVRKYLKTVDCVVLPSYREGMSRVLLEAAAMGKVILTNDVPGCKEIVEENKNGFLSKPKNVETLKQNILKIANLPKNKIKEMGLFSRKKVEKEFDEIFVINEYKKIIEKLS